MPVYLTEGPLLCSDGRSTSGIFMIIADMLLGTFNIYAHALGCFALPLGSSLGDTFGFWGMHTDYICIPARGFGFGIFLTLPVSG